MPGQNTMNGLNGPWCATLANPSHRNIFATTTAAPVNAWMNCAMPNVTSMNSATAISTYVKRHTTVMSRCRRSLNTHQYTNAQNTKRMACDSSVYSGVAAMPKL